MLKRPWIPLLVVTLLLGGLLLTSPETFESWLARKDHSGILVVSDIYGKVEKRFASDPTLSVLTAQTPLKSGDIVITHQDSKVLLQFSTAFWLMPFSKMEFILDGEQWQGHLLYGEVKKIETVINNSRPSILLSYQGQTITDTEFSSTREVIEAPLVSTNDEKFQELEEKENSPQTLIEKQIFQTLQLHRKFFQTCFVRLYKTQLGKVNGGETLFDLLIDVNGSIESAKVMRSDIDDKEYHQCLQSVFARMRFKNFSAKEPLHALFPIFVEMPTGN